MANRLLKIPALTYTAAVLGLAPRPARCRTVTEYYPNLFSTLGLSYGQSGGDAAMTNIGARVWETSTVSAVSRTICYPAVPGIPSVPAKLTYDQRTGWTGGARSIAALAGDGYAEFEVGPQTVGIVAGFARTDNSQLPGEVQHGFYIHRGEVDIFERGAYVLTLAVDLATRPRLRVSRAGGVVSYLVNGEWRYTSALVSTGQVHLDAALYTANDYVDNPVLAEIAAVSGSMRVGLKVLESERLRGRIGIGARFVGEMSSGAEKLVAGRALVGVKLSGVAMDLHTAAGVVTAAVRLSGRLGTNGGMVKKRGGKVAGGDHPRRGGRVSHGGWSVQALGGYPKPITGGGRIIGPAHAVSGRLLKGIIGSGHCSYHGHAVKGAESGYAGGRVRGGAYRAFGRASPFAPGVVSTVESIILADYMLADGGPVATFQTILQLETGITATLVGNAAMMDVLLITTSMQSAQDLEALFSSTLVLSTQADPARSSSLQYAVNASTGAFTCYEGFNFLGFATLPSGVFGVKADGIYRIGAAGDNGAAVRAVLDLGQQDFGTPSLKRIDYLYLNADTDGEVQATLRADDGQEYSYRVIDYGSNMRAQLAKGVSGRQWRLRLEMIDASRVELDGIELGVANTGRRLGR